MKNRHITFTTILLTLGCLGLLPTAQAVVPAPDGGYPGYNTAEGQNALFSLTIGVWNTALGAYTLYVDTTGRGNTAVGINGLRNNISGSFNTAVGLNALFTNNGDPNAHQAIDNCAFGSNALFSNNTGSYNCAFGFNALFYNRVNFNTAIGAYALFANGTGVYNTATGYSALANGNGSSNTANGTYALSANFNGSENTATGMQALFHNDIGGANTAVGAGALGANTSGGANTAIGHGAGANVMTGSFNVYIGTNVGGVPAEVGHTYISNISSTQQNFSPVTIDLATGLLGHEFSSRRYKEDIKPMNKASEALFALKPVTYRYKKEIDRSQPVDYGLVAEEVAKVDPNLAIRDQKGQIESVRYNAINAMLLNEFLKEHKRVEQQTATTTQLQAEIASLTVAVTEQASRLQKLSARIELSGSASQQIALKAR